MPDLNYLAVLVAITAAFVLSGVWYAILGGQLASLHPAYAEPQRTQAATVPVELVRNLVVALVTAVLASQVGTDDAAEGLLLGLLLWIGFPAMILAGSVFHEKVPPRLAAIHAGDWLLKLLLIAGVVGAWQ
jgi:uncharacterized protein DUF1761